MLQRWIIAILIIRNKEGLQEQPRNHHHQRGGPNPPPPKKKKKYENNKSRLQEQALNKCRELSNEEKDIKLCLRKIKKNYKSITKSLLFVYRIKNEC